MDDKRRNMKKVDTFKKNKEIAKFMGGVFYEDTPLILEVPIKSPITGNNITCIDKLKYHESWDWIMQVVTAIEQLEEHDRNHFSGKPEGPRTCNPYRVDIINRNMVEIIYFGEDSIVLIDNPELTKIEAVYEACFQFITKNKP
jgi:hypothetical protein